MRKSARSDHQDVPQLQDRSIPTLFDQTILPNNGVSTSQQFYLEPTWLAVCGKHFEHLRVQLPSSSYG